MANASSQGLGRPTRHANAAGSRARSWLALCAVSLAALVVAWPTRNGQFLSGDDERLILNHFLVNHPSPANAWTLLSRITDDLYQPLPMISFQLNYWMAGPDPAGRFAVGASVFHWTHIALHMINSVLAFLVIRGLTSCARIGLLTGLLFAVHPFAIEPVAWINGRMILMATCFSLLLLSVCMHTASGTGNGNVLSIVAWLAALMCKVIPTVPLVGALWERHVRGPLDRRRWGFYGLLIALAAAATAFAASSTFDAIGSDLPRQQDEASLPVRLLLAARYYLESYTWPMRQCAWVPPAKNVSFISAPCLIAMGECAGFLLLLIAARRRNRLAFLGLTTFALLILPFIGAGAARRLLAADRYMYLPIIGLHLAVASVVVRIMDGLRSRAGAALARVTVGLPVTATVATCAGLSWQFANTWKDALRRDERVAQIYSGEPEAHAQLAKAHLFMGAPDAALGVLAESRLRWPDNARLAAAAGDAYRAIKDWPAAERELRVASDKMPEHLRTQYLHALTLEDLGRRSEAIARYKRIVEMNSAFLPAITALARCDLADGREEDAIKLSEQALAINPNNVESLRRLAGLLMSRTQDARALELLERAARIDSTDVTATAWLQILLVEAGRGNETAHLWFPLLFSSTDGAEAHAWFWWAWYLAPRDEQGGLATFLQGPSDECEFEQWAVAVQALASGDEAKILRIDASGALGRPFTILRAEKRRMIISTIHQLPDRRKNSAAAEYLVARAFMVGGDSNAARRIAADLAATPTAGPWQQAVRSLLSEPSSTSQSAPH